jgi:hypothetical protein
MGAPSKNNSTSNARLTSGEVFADGTQLFLLRSGPSAAQLFVWSNEAATAVSSYSHNGQIYQPLLIDLPRPECLRLPSTIRPCESLKSVLTDMVRVLMEHTTLKNSAAWMLASFSVATWFADCFDIAPSVILVGQAAGELAMLLQLLSCFCRHSYIIAEPSAANLLGLPLAWHPTVLISYAEGPSKSVQAILSAASCRGLLIPRQDNKLADLFGMKILAGPDVVDLNYALCLPVPPRHRGSPLAWNDELLHSVAEQFQAQLLDYRLRQYQVVSNSTWDIPEFGSPNREIARSLGRCLVSDELRKELVHLLRWHDQESRAQASIGERSVLIEGLLAACHDKNKDSVYVGEMTKIVTAIFEARGEKPTATPRGIGALLKTLGLQTQRLGKAGRGLLLREATRENIHRLALEYRVPSIQDGVQRCCLCAVFVDSGAR